MAGRRRSCFVPWVGPIRPSPEYTSADQILSLGENGVITHRLVTARPNRPRAQRFTATNHIGPLLSGSDSSQARGYNRRNTDRASLDCLTNSLSKYISGRTSHGRTPGGNSPGQDITSGRTSPRHASSRISPGYTSDRASSGYTSGRASPEHSLGRASPEHTSGRTSPRNTSCSSAPGCDSDNALSGYTSGRTSPGYRSDHSSILSLVSIMSMNMQPAESNSQQLHPDREWSFTDIDIHAIVDRDFRFITITPSTSEDGMNSDLPTGRRRQSWSEDEKQYLIQAMGRALAIKAMEDAEEEIVAMARKCPYSIGADLSSTEVSAQQERNKIRSKLFEKFQERYSQATCLRDQTDNRSCPSLPSQHQPEYCGGSLLVDYNTFLSPAQKTAWLSGEFDTAEREPTQDEIHQVDPYNLGMHTTLSNERRCHEQDGSSYYDYSDEMNKEYRRKSLRYISDPSMSSSSELSDALRWESGAPTSVPGSPARQRQTTEQSCHRKHGHASSRSFRLFSHPHRTQGSKKRSSGRVTGDFSRQYLQDHAHLTSDCNLRRVLRYTNRSRLPSSDYTNQRYNMSGSPQTSLSIEYDSIHRTSHHKNAFQTRDNPEVDADRHRSVTSHVIADNVSSRPHDPGIFRGHSTHRVTDYFDCRPPRSMQGRLPSSFCPHNSGHLDRRLDEIRRQIHHGLAERRGSVPTHSAQGIRKYHEKGSLVLDLSPSKRT